MMGDVAAQTGGRPHRLSDIVGTAFGAFQSAKFTAGKSAVSGLDGAPCGDGGRPGDGVGYCEKLLFFRIFGIAECRQATLNEFIAEIEGPAPFDPVPNNSVLKIATNRTSKRYRGLVDRQVRCHWQ